MSVMPFKEGEGKFENLWDLCISRGINGKERVDDV